MGDYYNMSESMEGLAGKFKTEKNKELETAGNGQQVDDNNKPAGNSVP